VERIEPIARDRTVRPVELTRLTPVEREQEKQRRERERERRRKGQPRPQSPRSDGGSGIDVRV
jgi:hypothetical protein